MLTIDSLDYLLEGATVTYAPLSVSLTFGVYNSGLRRQGHALTLQGAQAALVLNAPVYQAYVQLAKALGSEQTVPEDIDQQLMAPELIDYTDLDAACQDFKALCSQIDAVLPAEYTYKRPFTGGFDEGKAAMAYMTASTLPLALALMTANDACEHEARKVGLCSPKWFKRMWGI